jgi:hypothetical protein
MAPDALFVRELGPSVDHITWSVEVVDRGKEGNQIAYFSIVHVGRIQALLAHLSHHLGIVIPEGRRQVVVGAELLDAA